MEQSTTRTGLHYTTTRADVCAGARAPQIFTHTAHLRSVGPSSSRARKPKRPKATKQPIKRTKNGEVGERERGHTNINTDARVTGWPRRRGCTPRRARRRGSGSAGPTGGGGASRAWARARPRASGRGTAAAAGGGTSATAGGRTRARTAGADAASAAEARGGGGAGSAAGRRGGR